MGLRRLGGIEKDYEAKLRAFFVHEAHGRTDGERSEENREFFEHVCETALQLLEEETELGVAYSVDVTKTPAERIGRRTLTLKETVDYFDSRGRTWERQALVKARPIAGDASLGLEFLDAVEPWVYRRYLSRADVTGIKALKRRLERRTERTEPVGRDIEGGVLDVEFTVQYLQLINGGDQREVRVGNTLRAIEQLEQASCLTPEESGALRSNYDWLRRVEHRIEIMHTAAPNSLPNDPASLRKLALQCGYQGEGDLASEFRDEFLRRTGENREIVNRVLSDTFAGAMATDAEADLVLDHNPDAELVKAILAPYGFSDLDSALRSLTALGTEKISFLSTRRCRHFLSLIAKRLLETISKTPSPDATLASLCRVSESIGGKGVLWELFHLNPPSLDLYVRLCSSSPYLTSILTRYPGMIDELLDSLLIADLPTLGELQMSLDELCSKVDDIKPVLHSFKHTQHLNVGVRELLGKSDVGSSTAALADVAESCLQHITWHEQKKLVRKFGQPFVGDSDKPCELVILGMGKFGGREPNYHSDVDVIVTYEAAGSTKHPPTIRNRDETSNGHFFGELGRRIVKVLSENTEYGRLYDSDARLRPIGTTGPNAVSLDEFRDYYLGSPQDFAAIRLLCQARPVYGSEAMRARAADIVREVLTQANITGIDSESLSRERHRLQQTAGPRNLKRGPGGTLDIEFVSQALQLRHARETPDVLRTNTLNAIEALKQHSLLDGEDADALSESYVFLRKVEARLRLLNTTARHDLPRDREELERLAYLMRFDGTKCLESECARYTRQNRRLFDRLTA